MKRTNKQGQKGYALVMVLMIATISFVLTAKLIDNASANARIYASVKKHSGDYYEVENVFGKVTTWLQNNDDKFLEAFTGGNFNTLFDGPTTPAPGDNQGTIFSVPTLLKVKGTAHSPMLTNTAVGEFFGTASFPNITQSDSTVFNPTSTFASQDFGDANSRLLLVWAKQSGTDYSPIFRVDVVTGNSPDRGVHSYAYINSTFTNAGPLTAINPGFGFFGRDLLESQTGNNTCASYTYTYNAGPGTWTRSASPRNNCLVASSSAINLTGNVSGSAYVNSATCTNCATKVSGTVCANSSPACNAFVLPTYDTWADYLAAAPCSGSCVGGSCSNNISANTTYNTNGCYGDVSVDAGQILTLQCGAGPSYPTYYFKRLAFSGSARLRIRNASNDNCAPGEKLIVYVEQFNSNDKVNSNNLVNTNNAPYQFEIRYYGTNNYELNGTAVMNGVFIAPNAEMILNGNFNMFGAVWTPRLYSIGNNTFNYDESLGVTSGSSTAYTGMTFSMNKASQRFR